MKNVRNVTVALAAATLLAPTAVGASTGGSVAAEPTPWTKIERVVTFGDSWSSANQVYGTRPGGAWPQLLAQSLGSSQAADTDGGENYARGGAFVAPIEGVSKEGFPTPVSQQIDAYVAKHGTFAGDQLVTLWAGGNDLFAYIGAFDTDNSKFCQGTHTKAELDTITSKMSDVADTEVAAVRRILALGSKKVAVLDMVDLGLTANDACMSADANSVAGAMSKVHNLALYKALDRAGLLNDERVDFVPISSLFSSIASAPTTYGFDVVDGDPCPAGFAPCTPDTWPVPDADRTYVFGQSGHFNAHTRELIAGTVLDTVKATWPQRAPAVKSTLSFKLSKSSVKVGDNAKATIAVRSKGVAAPTGRLELRKGSKVLKRLTLRPQDKGKRTFTVPKLPRGKHTLRVVYSGDGTVKGASSAARILRVK